MNKQNNFIWLGGDNNYSQTNIYFEGVQRVVEKYSNSCCYIELCFQYSLIGHMRKINKCLFKISSTTNCANSFCIFLPINDWIIFQISQFLFRSLTLKMFGSSNLFFGLIIVVLGCAYAMPQDSVPAEIGEILSSCSLIPGILNFIEFSWPFQVIWQ